MSPRSRCPAPITPGRASSAAWWSTIWAGHADPAKPAWLLEIQEPEPGTAPDPAPNDEEHHRLPDGTTLHVYVWTHRLGGQLTPDFVPQPQNTGWVEVFEQVPNPVYAIRR